VLNHLLILISFLIFLNGCTTTAILNEMNTHSENIEVTISPDRTKILWKSDPDYFGSIEINPQKDCNIRKVFIPTKGYLEKQPEVIPSQEIQLKFNRGYFNTFKDEFTARLNPCDLYLIEGPICESDTCHKAVSLDIINSTGDIESSTRLTRREDIPVEYWPMLALGAAADTVAIGGLIYIAIYFKEATIANILITGGYYLFSSEDKNKDPK